ncbi:MAG: serine hydrolase domain-containing protein [Acidimicrobiales bacterium]
MPDLPTVTPRYASQPDGVPWPTSDWPRGPASDELRGVVAEAFTRPELAITQAVVVVQHGVVRYSRYGGEVPYFDRPAEPVTAQSPLLSWSMAKSMLHFVIGTLVEEGRLDPDAEAGVPEWDDPEDPRRPIRLADLLAMRDGLAWIENYEIGQTSDVIEMLFGEGKGDVAGYAARAPRQFEPDTRFNYSSGTSNLLSRLVADRVGYGEGYARYLSDRLFGPLGMASARPTFDQAGVWVASSFLHATALDFARFGLLYLRGGEWNGQRLLSRAWTDTAQRPLSRDEESGDLYAWQWWVTGDEYGTYWASGYEGQMINVVPALDAVVVRLGRSPEENGPDRDAWRRRVLAVLAG